MSLPGLQIHSREGDKLLLRAHDGRATNEEVDLVNIALERRVLPRALLSYLHHITAGVLASVRHVDVEGDDVTRGESGGRCVEVRPTESRVGQAIPASGQRQGKT